MDADLDALTARYLERLPERPCLGCGEQVRAGFPRCMGCWGRDGEVSADDRVAIMSGRITYGDWLRDRRTMPTRAAESLSWAMPPAEFRTAIADPAVLAWAKGSAPLLVLAGPTGTGKTWQSWGALRALRHLGTMQHVKCAALIRLARDEYSTLVTAGALVLDDLAARSTPAAIATALEVLDERMDHRRKTVVTTNASMADLGSLEPRLASRLASGTIVRMDGEDRRIAARRQRQG